MEEILNYNGYYCSEFYEVSNKMMNMIEEKFNQYKLIEGFNIHSSDKEGYLRYVKEKLYDCNEVEKYALNEMTKMLSQTNCSWKLYSVGSVLHKALIDMWYPTKVVIEYNYK